MDAVIVVGVSADLVFTVHIQYVSFSTDIDARPLRPGC